MTTPAQANPESGGTTTPATTTPGATTPVTSTGTPQGTQPPTTTPETPTTTTAPTGTPVAPDFTKLAVPEEGKTFIDPLTIDTIVSFAKESGWTLEDAQNAVNEQALMLARADHEHLKQLTADPDYGGDKLAETQKLARSVIDLVRPEGHPRREAFFRTLNRVAAGNNPEVVAFLADLGKRAAEDSIGAGSSAHSGGERDAATVLYGPTKTS